MKKNVALIVGALLFLSVAIGILATSPAQKHAQEHVRHGDLDVYYYE